VALLASVKSCLVSDQAYKLTEEEYKAARFPVLVGTVNDKGDALLLRAADSAMTLQNAKVYYPPKLLHEVWTVSPPALELSLLALRLTLEDEINKRVKKEPGQIKISDEDAGIPIVIEPFYVAKGESHFDRALYLVRLQFTLTDDPASPPHVKFLGLTFIKHLKTEDEPHKTLSHLWEEMESGGGVTFHQPKFFSD
jgi:hypothetical protein